MVDDHHVWHQCKWICNHSSNILQLKIIIRDLGKHACLIKKRKKNINKIGFHWFVFVFILKNIIGEEKLTLFTGK